MAGQAAVWMLSQKFAAENHHVEIMSMLTGAGVVDTGSVLLAAADFGRESSVQFLLQRQEWKATGPGAGYLDTVTPRGITPLACSVFAFSPRVMRLLVDAGADTAAAVRLTHDQGDVYFDNTALALVDTLRKSFEGKAATGSQLHSL